MGILNRDGTVNNNVMPVFAGIFAGLFFDDLRDRFNDDIDCIQFVFDLFKQYCESGDYQQMFLYLAIQYDEIRKQLPDPVWLLAGNKEAVKSFMPLFMARLESLMSESVFVSPIERGDEN
jgi:hypothetical protein